jgi:FkbM family methyltransferase
MSVKLLRVQDPHHPLRRYVFRRGFVRKVSNRLQHFLRRSFKDEFIDQRDLLELLGPVETIFDCGANIGHVTQRYLELFPRAHVHAFEPNPDLTSAFRERYQNNPRVSLHTVAVGETRGSATFNVNSNSGVSSFLAANDLMRQNWGSKPSREVTVEVTTLDELAREQGIDHINILKLDVEGSEAAAMRGARDLLARNAVDIVYTEVFIVPVYERQPLLCDLVSTMREFDYTLYNLYDFSESSIRQAMFGNAIFTSPRLRAKLGATRGVGLTGWQ